MTNFHERKPWTVNLWPMRRFEEKPHEYPENCRPHEERHPISANSSRGRGANPMAGLSAIPLADPRGFPRRFFQEIMAELLRAFPEPVPEAGGKIEGAVVPELSRYFLDAEG